MKLNSRSIRFRLCLWYVVFTFFCLLALSAFSYAYLNWALTSTSERTLTRRVGRLTRFMNYREDLYGREDFADAVRRYTIAGPDENYVQIDSMDGRKIYPADSMPASLPWPKGACLQPCFGMAIENGHRIRMVTIVATIRGAPMVMHVGGIVDEHNSVLNIVFDSYLVFLPLLLIVAVAGGYGLSSRALVPVARLSRAARGIGVHELGRRLPVPDTQDELQDLAETCNELLTRIQIAVERLKQFTSDISHDLRTSIAIMLSAADLCLRRPRTVNEYQHTIDTVRSECEAISVLLADLLVTSRAGIGDQQPELVPTDLSAIVAEVSSNSVAATEIKSHTFIPEIEPGLFIYGDASTVRRLVHILVDNAIKYTPSAGRITVRLQAVADAIEFQVSDNGIGISPEDSERIFERFYRVETSRNRDQGGSGLGLAIAKWIVDIHSAKIRIASGLGRGSTFTVSFPRYTVPGLILVSSEKTRGKDQLPDSAPF